MPRTYIKHDLVGLRSEEYARKRKGRSLVDRRSSAGRNAMNVQAALIADLGGAAELSTARLVLIELIARDIYFLDECDRRIYATLKKFPTARDNPKVMGTMYGYRSSVANNLSRNLAMLGLDRIPPKAKTLSELLDEQEDK
jgi:hypothetical protein